eukprot:10826471-Alexandrium_andersonii.AAC.1
MSASLVGSEMCIRDSLRVELRQLRQTKQGTSGRLCALLGPTFASRAWKLCLLYTSDAADDM